jgi:hypothetical protein
MAKMDDGRTRRAGERDTGFGAAGLPNFDPLFQASNRFLETWMAVSNEILEFSKSRLDRGLEMGRALAQSTSLNEAIDVQAKFTRSTVHEYLSEANKLADLGTRSLMDSFSTLQRTAHDTADHRAEAAE